MVCGGERRPLSEKNGRRRRFPAPRLDSFGCEDEGDEAERLGKLDELGEVPGGGDLRRMAAAEGGRERRRFSELEAPRHDS